MSTKLTPLEQEIVGIADSLQNAPEKLSLFLQSVRSLTGIIEQLDIIGLNAAENVLRQGNFQLAHDIALGRGHTSDTWTAWYNKVETIKNELLLSGDHKTACKLHLKQNYIMSNNGEWKWFHEPENKSATLWFTELSTVAMEQKDYLAAFEYNEAQWYLLDGKDKKQHQETILRFHTIAKEAWQSGLCELAIDSMHYIDAYERNNFTSDERRVAFSDAKKFYKQVHKLSQEDKLQKMKESFTDEKNWFAVSSNLKNTL